MRKYARLAFALVMMTLWTAVGCAFGVVLAYATAAAIARAHDHFFIPYK